MIQKKTVYKIVTILIGIIFVFFLLSKISVKDLLSTLFSLDPLILFAGFGLYFCTYLLRAFRFSILLNRSVSVRDLLPIICVHNFIVNILPSRTGEVSYVYLLKKIHAKTTGEGVATLVVARIFDFITVIILLFIAGLFIYDVPETFVDFLWIVYFFLFSLVGLLISLIYFGQSVLKFLNKFMLYIKLDKTKVAIFLLRKGDEIIQSIKRINVRQNAISLCIVSLSIWLVAYTGFYVILMGLGVSLPVQNVIFGAVLVLLTGVLPTPGIAGFGTGQAIWTVIYVPLGMTLEGAIISGFSWHIVLLLFSLILGLLGSFMLRKQCISIFKIFI